MKTQLKNAKVLYGGIVAALILVLCIAIVLLKANPSNRERFPVLSKSVINDLPPTPTPNVNVVALAKSTDENGISDGFDFPETTAPSVGSTSSNEASALAVLSGVNAPPSPVVPVADLPSPGTNVAVAVTSPSDELETLKEVLNVRSETSIPLVAAPSDDLSSIGQPILQETEAPSLSVPLSAEESALPSLEETTAPAEVNLLAEKGSVPRIYIKDDVKRLQTALRVAGLSQDPVDGIWGQKTSDIIGKYQQDNGLEVTGKPGPRTWALLYDQVKGTASGDATPQEKKLVTADDASTTGISQQETAAPESEADILKEKGSVPKIWDKADVKRLQTALRVAGLSEEPVDGLWGEKTGDIITKLQQDNGLETTGKPGPQTWALVYKMAQEKLQGVVPVSEASAEASAATTTTQEIPQTAVLETAETAISNSNLLQEKGRVPKIWDKADVKRLQTALRAAGVSEEPVDGLWGEKTSDIITKLQQDNGLETTGKPGPKTWDLIYKKIAEKQNGVADNAPMITPTATESAQETSATSVQKEDVTSVSKVVEEVSEPQPKESGTVLDIAALLGEKGRVPRTYDDYDVKRLQAALRLTGYSNDPVDGFWGEKTSAAVTEFQKQQGLETTGKPGKLTWGALYPLAKEKQLGNNDANTTKLSEATKLSTTETDTKTSVSVNEPLLPPTEAPSGKNADLTYRKTDGPEGESEKERIIRIQNRLNDMGYKLGAPTGSLGPRTRQAIKDVQKNNGLAETGNLNDSRTEDAIFGKYKRSAFAKTTKRERTIDVATELSFLENTLHTKANSSNTEDVKEIEALLERARTSEDVETAQSLLNDASARIGKLNKASETDAQSLFADVEKQYQRFKTMFGSKLKKNNKSTYEKIEKAFSSMKSDLNNGAYDNVMRLGPGFKNSMDQIVHTLSKDYVSKILATPSMTKQMSSDSLAKVKSLQRQGRIVEAAELAQQELDKKQGTKKN